MESEGGAGIRLARAEPHLVICPLRLVLSIVSLALFALPCPARSIVPYRITLPSGLRLIVVSQPGARLAAVEVRVRVGSAMETPANNGGAHLIEHLVFKGGDNGKPGEIDAAVEALGGELTARTSRESTRYATVVPPANAAKALEIIAGMLLHPAFRPDDIANEKIVIAGESADSDSEPARSGYSDLAATAFDADDADRLPLMGSPETLATLDHVAVKRLHGQWYRPENMTVVVVGDIKADDLVPTATRLFPPSATIPPPPIASPPAGVPVQFDGVTRAPLRPRSRQLDSGLATVFFAFSGPSADDIARQPAIDTLLPLLAAGGDRGRLGHALVGGEKSTLSVGAEFLPGRRGGLIILSATGPREDTARLESGLLAAVIALRESPATDSEVANARAHALSEVEYGDTVPAGLARRLADEDARGVPPAVADSYPDRVRLVTADAVRALIEQYLTPTRRTVAVIGVAAKTPPVESAR